MKLLFPLAIVVFLVSTGIGLLFLTANNETSQTSLIILSDNGDFTLHNAKGDVHLSDFKKKIVLIYFGYASCPDICPTSLAFMGNALNKLREDELKKVQVLFVSVDPERDTVKKLADYTAYFHPNILGITGSKQEIDKVVKQYGASYKKVASDSAIDYIVDHTASFYRNVSSLMPVRYVY